VLTLDPVCVLPGEEVPLTVVFWVTKQSVAVAQVPDVV
jgi:hypothetical protein